MKLIIIFIVAMLPLNLTGTNYFVDASSGDDRNSGESPSLAWSSIDKVNLTELLPGDSVLFKKGETFRGNLIPQSGNENNNIYYGAYGNGEKPRIFGSYERNSPENWKNTGNNIWQTSQIKSYPNGAELLPNSSIDTDLSDWYLWFNKLNEANAELTRTIKKNEYYLAPGGIKIFCESDGISISDLQLYTNKWHLNEFKWYKLSFYAKASKSFQIKEGQVQLMKATSPYTDYSIKTISDELNFGMSWNYYELYFKTGKTADDARLTFFLGNSLPDSTIFFLDEISLKECSTEPESLKEDIGNIIFNGGETIGVKKWQKENLSGQGDFWYDQENNQLLMWSVINPALFYTDTELARNKRIIDITDKSYIILENLDIRYGANHGIDGINTNHIIIKKLDISYIGGGKLQDTIRFGNAIQFWNDAHDNMVEKCFIKEIYDAAITAQGIETSGHNVSGLIFRNNIIVGCEYSFEFWQKGTTTNVSEIYFENNTCVNAGGGWSHIQRPDPNGTHIMLAWNESRTNNLFIRNNIFYNSTEQSIRWHNISNLNDFKINYNCWYEKEGAFARIEGAYYNYSEGIQNLQSQSGQFKNAIFSDPLFSDGYSLGLLSPCIGSGKVIETVKDDYYGSKRNPIEGYDIGAIIAGNFLTSEYISICQGDSYEGLNEPGQYIRHLTSKSGRDSIVVTNLSVFDSPVPEVYVVEDTLISKDSFVSYQWFDKDGEINGENSDRFVIKESGVYWLRVTDVNGCYGYSDSLHIYYSGNALNKVNQFKFKIFPVPSSGGIFMVELDELSGNPVNLSLIDNSGNEIESRYLKKIFPNQIEYFSSNDLPKGTYFLIISSDKIRTSKKIIIY